MKIVDCCDVCDATIASLYLTLHQVKLKLLTHCTCFRVYYRPRRDHIDMTAVHYDWTNSAKLSGWILYLHIILQWQKIWDLMTCEIKMPLVSID